MRGVPGGGLVYDAESRDPLVEFFSSVLGALIRSEHFDVSSGLCFQHCSEVDAVIVDFVFPFHQFHGGVIAEVVFQEGVVSVAFWCWYWDFTDVTTDDVSYSFCFSVAVGKCCSVHLPVYAAFASCGFMDASELQPLDGVG